MFTSDRTVPRCLFPDTQHYLPPQVSSNVPDTNLWTLPQNQFIHSEGTEDQGASAAKTPIQQNAVDIAALFTPPDIQLHLSSHMPVSASRFLKPTKLDIELLVTPKKDIEHLPEEDRNKASSERNFFHAVVRRIVEESNMRSIKGHNYRVLASKVHQLVPNFDESSVKMEKYLKRALGNFITYKKRRERSTGEERNVRRKIQFPTDYLENDEQQEVTPASLTHGKEICLVDRDFPVAKAKVIQYPAIEHGMTEEQRNLFASVQITLKKRNTEISFMPYAMDNRDWKDIGKGCKVAWCTSEIRPVEFYDQYMQESRKSRMTVAREMKKKKDSLATTHIQTPANTHESETTTYIHTTENTPAETSTHTETPNNLPTLTPSETSTHTEIPNNLPTFTPSETSTHTETPNDLPTLTPSETSTHTEIPINLPTLTPSETSTHTETPNNLPTLTQSETITHTETPNLPTFTPSETSTHTEIPINLPTLTPSETSSHTETPNNLPTFTPSETSTHTETPNNLPTFTPSETSTHTETPNNLPTCTPSETSTHTETPNNLPTFTPSETSTHTETLEKTDLTETTEDNKNCKIKNGYMINQFVEVLFGKKTFYARIEHVDPDIVVSFLRDTNIPNVKRFPPVEDTSTVFPEEIVRKLDQPSYDRRGRFVFA